MNFKDTLAINFYRFFLAPLGLTVLVFLVAPFNKKVRKTLSLKFRPGTRFSSHSIWFHSASGEFEYCKPLIRQISQKTPDARIFCSYTSPSYALRVQKFHGVDGYGPLPLDLPGPVGQFLKDLSPKALLIAKTDLWPELIFQCWQKKVPVVPFAVVAKNSGSPFSFLKRWMYNKCEKVLCMTEIDAKNLKDMGVTVPVETCGDPRIDQIMDRVQSPDRNIPDFLKTNDPTLILGSSWPEDEKVILSAVLAQMKTKTLKVLICPHEPSQVHFETLQKYCRKHNLNLEKYSQTHSRGPETLIYGDTVGVLADLYAASDMAFIGGSFKSQVHSVGEAIGHGNRVIVGPKNANNREAQIFKNCSVNGYPVVTEVHDSVGFKNTLEQLLTHPEHLKEDRSVIQKVFHKHTGATKKVLDALSDILEPTV